MFAIYNKGSLSFRSTVDNLYDLKKVITPSTVRNESEGVAPEYDSYDGKPSGSNKNNEALNAYKKNANIDMKEVIYHVEQIMTRDMISIDESFTIQEAYDTLKEHEIQQLPIVTNENKIFGMIGKRDILNLLMEDLEEVNHTVRKKVNEVVFRELITTDPISDIRRVAKVMIDFNLNAIPVVNKRDELLGVISKTDILKAVSTIPDFQLLA